MNFNVLVNPTPGVESQAGGTRMGSDQATTPFLGHLASLSKSPHSLVQDALEELAMGSQEFMKDHVKDRKIEKSRPKSIDDIAKYLEYIGKVEDLEEQKYLDAGDSATELSDLLNHDKVKDDDITQKFLGLLGLLRDVRQKNSQQGGCNERLQHLEKQLTTELAQLEQDHGKEIRAGININKAHNIFAGEISPKALRCVYKETILDYQSLAKAYGAIVEQFGSQRFKKGLTFLLKALAADLHAALPSMAKNQLARILEDMCTLKILISIHEKCEEAMTRFWQRAKKKKANKNRRDRSGRETDQDDDSLDSYEEQKA